MSDSDRPNKRKEPDADRAPRAESAQPMAGRSGTVAEIGRELGDLDFEPDDLLASLRPFEPEAAGSSTQLAEGSAEGSSELAAPRLPQWDLEGSRPEESFVTGAGMAQAEPDHAELEHVEPDRAEPAPFSADEPLTNALLKPEQAAVERDSQGPASELPDVDERRRAVPAPRLRPQRSLPATASPSDELSWSAPLPEAPPEALPEAPTAAPIELPFESPPLIPAAPSPPLPQRSSLPKRPLAPPRPVSPGVPAPQRPESPIGSPAVAAPTEGAGDSNAPDVVTSEDAAILEELVALPPERTHGLSFELERPACEHLRERELVDAYHSLAVILTREAQSPRHPQEQAEIAFVNSELLAMLGEVATAREYLHALTPTSTPTTALQARQLAFAGGDTAAYAQLLKSEIRSQISHESRRHLMALYADVLHLQSEDEAEARRHLELSLRAFPSDPRFWLQRLSDQLKDGNSPAKLRAPNVPDSPKLSDALRELLALRSATAKTQDCSHPAGPVMAARRAWQNRDFASLLEAIAGLRTVDELAAAAAWLHASLSAYAPAFRAAGTAFIEPQLEQGDPEAELALLERRLHAKTTLPTSLEALSLNSVPDLSPADRLSLALAVKADTDTLRVLVEDVARRDTTLPLAQAVQSLFCQPSTLEGQDDPSRIRLALGAAIGDLATARTKVALSGEVVRSDLQPPASSNDSELARARLPESITRRLRALAAADPTDELPKALQLLDAIEGGAPTELAAILSEFAPEVPESERGHLFVIAGLLAQLAGASDLQRKSLETAITHDARLEVAHRGLTACAGESISSPTLLDLVGRLEPSARRSLLDIEARLGHDIGSDSLLDSLQDSLASLPELAPFIQCLAATSSTPSTRGWLLLARHCKSPNVHLFVSLLDALVQSTRQGESQPPSNDPELAQGDPLAHTLLSSIGSSLAPLQIDGMMLDGRLLDWLGARSTLDRIPLQIDELDVQQLSALADRQSSPILFNWVNLHHGAKNGDANAFSKQLELAASAPTDAEYIDRILESAFLDEHREPTLGSIECARRILERAPNHLASLRLELRYQVIHNALHQSGPSAAKIAPQLDPPESLAHTWLAVVSTTYDTGVDANLEQSIHLDALASEDQPATLWTTRKLLNLARQKNDDARILSCINYLRQNTGRALDGATLTLRAAEAASRLEHWEEVGPLLDKAVELYPEHLVALSMRAEFLEARGALGEAANAFNALAEAACMPAHKVAAWVQAATLWSDAKGDTKVEGEDSSKRITLALERAVELDPSHSEATARLRSHYLSLREFDKLEQLLTRMLLRVDDATERAQIEYARAQALLELERVDEAQSGLERALSINPTFEPALILAASLQEQRGDFEGAEQQLLRLAGLCTDNARQLDAYRRLAVLYETYLEQPARAEKAYREVLQRDPNDPSSEQLVKLLLRQDNPQAAVELLQDLIEHAADPIVERARSLELARVFDEVMNDRRRAEEILDRTRRRWPNEASTLVALASFYQRGKDTVAFNTLLDRSVVDARRALTQGRFDSAFFEVIACVADLRDETDLGHVARTTVAAINAEPCEIDGIGPSAANDAFSDMLAPEVLSLPIRAMLRKTGWALCAAHPIDVRALRATPLAQTQPELSEHLRNLARAFGLFEIDLHLSPALGAVCQPTSSVPATLVVGTAFVALTDTKVRDALAIRALRILSANAAAFANTAPVDLWPLLVAYLSAYLPDWLPPAVDPNKIAPIRQRIRAVLPKDTDPDLPMLAADVAASIGNRASQLGIAVQQWGSRTALLSLGNPEALLTAIAAASGQLERLSTNPAERQKWIVRNPEARDLTIFSVSNAYVEARARALGRS